MKMDSSVGGGITVVALVLVVATVVNNIPTATAQGEMAGIPGLGGGIPKGWTGGFGGGFGGPNGGRSFSGTIRPTTVCKEKGPCYKKKLTCPAECFKAWAKSGKNYGEGGAQGGCVVDCKKKCIAYC